MKKINLILIGSIIFIMILAACGGKNQGNTNRQEKDSNDIVELKYQPENINPNTDVCDICAMAVADDEHATQIILKKERSLKFDDLGCLYTWIEENGDDEIGAKFVRDFNTEEWILLEEATYVFDKDIETPMAYGIISFKDRSSAESFIEENDLGELLFATDLKDHKWEMMNHDHSHHDHDEHSHAFHTEGFDMYFSELKNVTVAEETKLEVNITLNDSALQDANVRYEIWKENDKSNTDWINAMETTAGYYVADYHFKETGTYHIQIHVEDDQDLHEHSEVEINVKE